MKEVKVKCILVQVLRLCTGRLAPRGSRGITLLFHDTRWGEGSVSRPDRSLPLGKTRYPLCRRLGGHQGCSGLVPKISPPPGFDPWTVQPVASRYTDYATRPTEVGYGILLINPLTPNDQYRGRTAPLTFKVSFYMFIQQI